MINYCFIFLSSITTLCYFNLISVGSLDDCSLLENLRYRKKLALEFKEKSETAETYFFYEGKIESYNEILDLL